MKKVALFFGYLLIAIFFVILLSPKVQLYYKLEQLLQTKQVILTQEHISDSGLSLHVKEAKLYYGDMYVASLSELSITPLLIYNTLHIESFTLSKEMEQFLPRDIDAIAISYSVIDPLHVTINAQGAFGALTGRVDLKARHLVLDLEPSATLLKKRPFWMRRLKKVEGVYRYESSY